MDITLPLDKAHHISDCCQKLLGTPSPTIREVARVIGLLVASFPAVRYGKLHYRRLEKDKIQALGMALGKFDKPMHMSHGAKAELIWWSTNLTTQKRCLLLPPTAKEICTDASDKGWGAVVSGTKLSAGGRFTATEASMHINAKGLLGLFLGLRAFCENDRNVRVKCLVDNATAVSYIREMGGTHSATCNELARQIWTLAADRNIWLSVVHIPGTLNGAADRESRVFHTVTEWQLCPLLYQHVITDLQYTVGIDLMASRTNRQVDKFVSWRPDPDAFAVDAFTLPWTSLRFWCFPPFSPSLILRIVQKIRADQATGLLVVPNWPTQP